MKLFLNKYKYLLLTFLISFILFYPSLFGFYTNDDFYHLKISHATSVHEFINFFNLVEGSSGQLLYRPLTTHVFYFLGWGLFNLNPIGLHIVSFVLLFIVIYCVYKLAFLISENEKIAVISAFLYAVSATHFGHLYYLATEIVLGAVFFSTVIFFTKYIKSKSRGYLILSIFFFALSLLAKENSVVLPAVFVLLYAYFQITKKTKIKVTKFLLSLIPFAIILIIYMYFHFFYYGFVSGDSYLWNLSPIKALNTILWYGLWSFNLPEMLVDFIGPGLNVNPDLLKYWGDQIIPILVLFVTQLCILFYAIFKSRILSRKYESLFCIGWFLITLSPILFLPLHKFTFYLTLPLFGVVLLLSYLFEKCKSFVLVLFCVVWTATSLLTLNLTRQTNWITQGEAIARRVYDYVNVNKTSLEDKTVVFYDTEEDNKLPFSPTETVKNTLSDNNFFEVFYDGKIKAIYDSSSAQKDSSMIRSRMFIGY